MPKPDVLFVDLDGTLIATDLFRSSVFRLIRRRPHQIFRLPLLLRKGRAGFKHVIAQEDCAQPDVDRLPYRQDVIRLMNEFVDAGKPVVLATASNRIWAQRVAHRLGLFDDVLASDGTHNLKGVAKLQAIQAHCRRHRLASFGYIGDSHADLPIWEHAAGVYVVRPSRSLMRALNRRRPPDLILNGAGL